MNKPRYILEPYKGMNTRYRCPGCQQKDKTFSLYIDTETGEHIHPSVGRCNRQSKCGYHYTPIQYFRDGNFSFVTLQPKGYKPKPVTPQPKIVSFIDVEVFKASLKEHETNHFVKFLIDLFGVEVASELVSRYFIATSKYWNGATVFWQIDTQGKIRTGKIMLYSPSTGKRIKEPSIHINWVHKALKMPEFELKQCLFGEHLLIDKTKPVAIVESEKTAVIASLYLPQFLWLASGSLNNLNNERCAVLTGRPVTLFPDLNGYNKWKTKATELSKIGNFQVSDLLENKASDIEREQGLDLADYLQRFDLNSFQRETPHVEKISKPLPSDSSSVFSSVNKNEKYAQKRRNSDAWTRDILELEEYFKRIEVPITLKLNAYSSIVDVSLFIQSHIKTVKANNGNDCYLPYLQRLEDLREVLKTGIQNMCN